MIRQLIATGWIALSLATGGCINSSGGPGGGSMSLLTEGKGIQRLSSPVGDREHRVIWSPPYYAVTGEKPGLGAVGQEMRFLDAAYRRLSDVSWSSDGQRIALAVQVGDTADGSSSTTDNSVTIYVNEPGSFSFKALVHDVNDGAACVSPNGTYVVVADTESLGVFRHTLYDLQAQASKSLLLGDEIRSIKGTVVWSADGEKVARLMPKHRLYLADLRTNETRHYDSEATDEVGWSPDGKKFYAYDASSTRLIAQPLEGGSATSIALRLPSGVQGSLSDLKLSPDGQRIAFTVQGLRPQGVFISDLEGEQARHVVPPSRFVGWMPSGAALICLVNAENQDVSYLVNLSER